MTTTTLSRHRRLFLSAIILGMGLWGMGAQPIAAAPPKPNDNGNHTASTIHPRSNILIQAESEKTANVYTPSSRKEWEASHRRGWTGQGNWYLSLGGDTLTYEFNADPATYSLWVRDWTDDLNPVGARAIVISIDGANIGTFPENPNRDYTFHWHKVADVRLGRGRHSMVVSKANTTSAAALLDAFHLIPQKEAHSAD